jgi:hypothetical protein
MAWKLSAKGADQDQVQFREACGDKVNLANLCYIFYVLKFTRL